MTKSLKQEALMITSLNLVCFGLSVFMKALMAQESNYQKRFNMENRALYNWLEYEWRISNHPKYQHYFKEWVENLTDAQIVYFNEMRTRKIYR